MSSVNIENNADPSTTDEDGTSEDFSPNMNDIKLLCAAANGDLLEVTRLLSDSDADPCYQDTQTGMSILMAAAGAGHTEVVLKLLEEGAPWNAVDRQYLCAGDYAIRKGHQAVIDALMNHALMAEMILATFQQTSDRDLNKTYLSSTVEYTQQEQPDVTESSERVESRLVDSSSGLAVMMEWERPLMQAHAAFVCHAGTEREGQVRVLNVGFGMGIVDTAIQEHRPAQHVIIEAHPQVLARMEATGWTSKPNVVVVRGRWQDHIDSLGKFDGIFFDTYAEDDQDLREFHSRLPIMLAGPHGRYSYYNGMCPDNVFFHAVACENVRLQLRRLGLDCQFDSVKVDVGDPKLWEGLKARYWHFDTYYLPKCQFLKENVEEVRQSTAATDLLM